MGYRRIHYIDWLRVLAVLLLLPFHTLRVFNVNGPFHVKGVGASLVVNYLIDFIDRWRMPLLFVLAGTSAYLALGNRGAGRLALERVKRLLVPFVFGLLVLIAPQTWYGARYNSAYTGSFWHYLASGDFVSIEAVERTGTDCYGGLGFGHLWFILYLFLISLVVLPLIAAARTERGARRHQLRALPRQAG